MGTSAKPLIETNPYLRNPQERMRILEHNAYESCRFEGARGIKRITPPHKPARRKASRKKSTKGR